MAIAAAHCLDEDEEEMIAALRELVEDGADDTRGLGEDLRALRSKAAALEDAGALTPESWDWAENVERVARRAAETMAEQEGDIVQRALPLLSRRPGEEAFVAALRRQAATAGALAAAGAGHVSVLTIHVIVQFTSLAVVCILDCAVTMSP